MKIACLQFGPSTGDIHHNLNRADAVLSTANVEDLDILVLPALAFSGSSSMSESDIAQVLEPPTAGITSLWARTTALRYKCIVAAGYLESDIVPNGKAFESVILVNQDGETIANHRKRSHPFDGWIASPYTHEGDLQTPKLIIGTNTKFNALEFLRSDCHRHPPVVLFSMASVTAQDPKRFTCLPGEPDMDVLTDWVRGLETLIGSNNEHELIFVFANCMGSGQNVPYAGTSAILGIQHGEVKVYGLLGRGERKLLVVDTNVSPTARLVEDCGEADIDVKASRPAEHELKARKEHVPSMSRLRSLPKLKIPLFMPSQNSVFREVNGIQAKVEQRRDHINRKQTFLASEVRQSRTPQALTPHPRTGARKSKGGRLYGDQALIHPVDIWTPTTALEDSSALDQSPLMTPQRSSVQPQKMWSSCKSQTSLAGTNRICQDFALNIPATLQGVTTIFLRPKQWEA